MAKKKNRIKEAVETVESWVGMGPKAKKAADASLSKTTKKKKAAAPKTAKKGKTAVKKKKK